MISGNTTPNFSHNNLEMHLYRIEQHALGLKSPTLEGTLTFGTRVIEVTLISFSILPVSEKLCNGSIEVMFDGFPSNLKEVAIKDI